METPPPAPPPPGELPGSGPDWRSTESGLVLPANSSPDMSYNSGNINNNTNTVSPEIHVNIGGGAGVVGEVAPASAVAPATEVAPVTPATPPEAALLAPVAPEVPPVAEVILSPEKGKGGETEIDLYRAIEEAKKALEAGEKFAYVDKLADVIKMISKVAEEQGLSEEEQDKFAKKVLLSIYETTPGDGLGTDKKDDKGDKKEPDEDEEPELTDEEKAAKAEEEKKAETERLEKAKEEAEKALEATRAALVDITIRRKARSWDGLVNRGKEDGENYGPALEAYKDSIAEYAKTIKELGEFEGKAPEEILGEIHKTIFDERRKFADLELKMNNDLLDGIIAGASGKNFVTKLWSKRAKLIRAYANAPLYKKILIGAIVGGAGFALTSGTVGIGLGAALAIAAPTKFSLGLLGRRASARNVSKHSHKRQISRINKAEAASQEALLAAAGLDSMPEELLTNITNEMQGEVQWAQRRNRLGNILLLASAVTMAEGIMHMEGAAIPVHAPKNFITGLFGGGHHGASSSGGEVFPGAHTGSSGAEVFPGTGGLTPPEAPSTGIDMSTFHPNSFGGQGMSPNESVKSMFTEVIEKGNGIKVHGLTDERVSAIVSDLKANHVDFAFGMGPDGKQYLMDVAKGYDGVRTANENASGLQGASLENWAKVAEIAQKHGVTFSR